VAEEEERQRQEVRLNEMRRLKVELEARRQADEISLWGNQFWSSIMQSNDDDLRDGVTILNEAFAQIAALQSAEGSNNDAEVVEAASSSQ